MKRPLCVCVLAMALVAAFPRHATGREIFPGAKWQTAAAPEKLGWSSAKLAVARTYAQAIGSAAVMVVDNGVVVAAWGDLSRNFFCHSLRKSLLSALIGIHIEAGNITLTQTMEALGIDDDAPSLTPIEKRATVCDLLRARSGIYHPALGEGYFMGPMRPARGSHLPGTFWYYNNWDFNALGTIFEQQSGRTIFEEFDTRIAKALQMEDFEASACAYKSSGDDPADPLSRHRYYQFRMSTRDLARFGLLYLRNGRWRDRQIVPAQWVRESTARHSSIWPDGGYGYLWWTGVRGGLLANVVVRGHSFRASGAGVNMLIVLPYRRLVVVHRVDTFEGLPRQLPGQVGRLLWHLLDAAGETGIGDNPSIEAAKGLRLRSADLHRMLSRGVGWVGPNTGPIPGGDSVSISCLPGGKLFYRVEGNASIAGQWWLKDDRLFFDLMGVTLFFTIVQKGDTYQFFDPTGTSFAKFELATN